jgi:RHS repeat-associated protein
VTTGFTGQEEERDLGVVNMGGRIYDPRLARFLQADPFVSAPESSQGWNRYSYGLNSPMRYTDPTGFVTQQEAADHELTLDQFCAIYATACSDDLDQNQGFVYEGIAEEGTHTALEGPLPGQFITPFGVQDVLMHQQDEQNLVRWHEEDQAALITVELPHLNVHFVDANGHATMPGLQASLVADAEKRWSGQIGKYYVENTNFHDPDGKDVYFTVRSRRGRSSADTGGDAGDLFIQNENGPRKPGELQSAFAHEVGHILGAKDQYDQATNQIYSGHEHDLMGDSRIPGVRALESTIEEIMKFNGIPIVQ